MDIEPIMDRPTPVRPSVMREHIRCPYRASLLGKGWREPTDWDREPLIWMGTAIHAGVAAHFEGVRTGFLASASDAAQASLKRDWLDPPRVTPWTWERANKLVAGAITLILARYPLEQSQIVAVEHETGAGKPDLIYTKNEKFYVVDWKTHRKAPRELGIYDHDWQVWHYAWLCRELYGFVPAQVEVANLWYEPRLELVTHHVPISVERLNEWQEQAEREWKSYATTYPLAQRWTGCDMPWWPCEFKAHCHYGATLESCYILNPKPVEETR